MVGHVTASMVGNADDETLKRLRSKCVKDIENTIGNIRYDTVYAYRHPIFEEGYDDENG